MRALMGMGYVVLGLLAVAGALALVPTGIGLYFVTAGYAVPGELIYLDELAPNIPQAMVELSVEVALIIAGVVGCSIIRRRLRTSASS